MPPILSVGPAPSLAGVSWDIFAATLVVLGGSFGVTVRMLYKALQKRLEEKAAYAQERISQLEERIHKYFDAHERLRDRWNEFLREYLKVDGIRNQKVDALFRIVDQMQKTVEAIPPNMNRKIEEAFTHTLSELKLYVREIAAKEGYDV